MVAEVSGAIEQIIVVGAGECGAATAVALRDNGFTGAITLIGEELGAPYERPPLSKQTLTDTHATAPKVVLSRERCAELNIACLNGVAVVELDRLGQTVLLSDGTRLSYDRLVLATGSRVRPLDIEGGDAALLLRTFDDAVALKARLQPGAHVVIVGGGLIGLELASSARQLGCTVTVIEFAERVLSRAVPQGITDVIVNRHLAEHVDIRVGVGVQRIEVAGGEHRVVLSDGTAVSCDAVVAGIGVVPNVELAAAAGLAIDNGIRVDAQLQTSDEAIFAAGDCCSFPHPLFGGRRLRLETWRNAYDQARVVARTVLGHPDVFGAIPWFWSDQYDLGLQIAGMPDAAVEIVVRRRLDGGRVEFGLDGAGRIVSAAGVGPGTSVARDVRGAEGLIAREVRPDRSQLANPEVSVKSLAVMHHAHR
jgi:3-phenylpropionate/trans-cinnamate dioxygenase ferredoxin reductase component